MNAQDVKNYIIENDCLQDILENLGCHSIKRHSNYWTFGNPDGNNKQAVTIYDDLGVINYTRSLPVPSDIFTLIQYYKSINFFQALKYVCELLSLDIYSEPDQELPESLRLTKMLMTMSKEGVNTDEDDTPIKPLPEDILTYYRSYVNDFWKNDGVPYSIQRKWEISYDESTNRIVIPIRDEHGVLVGCKGRLFKQELDEDDLKYIYIEPTPRHKILYGLYKTMPFIQEKNMCYILEAEKAVHQLWAYGYKNSVATGGEKVSKTQIDKLTRLSVPLCFAFDKDVSQEKIQNMAEQFIDGVQIYYLWDDKNILKDKESPSDNANNWKYLIENCIYKLK